MIAIGHPQALSLPAATESAAEKWFWIDRVAVLVVVTTVMLRASVFFEFHPPIGVYYALLGMAVSILLIRGRIKKINVWLSVLFLCALLSIVANDIPDFFRPWERLLGWGFVLILCSPWLEGPLFRLFREKLCRAFDWILIAGVMLSWPASALGLTTILHGDLMNGLFCQSMMLGPIAGIVTLLIFHHWINAGQWRRRLYLGGGVLVGLYVVIASGSRGAIAAFIGGILFYFFTAFKFRQAVLILFVMGALAYFSFPWWEGGIELALKKFEDGVDRSGSLVDSRQYIWELRWQEFKDNPVFGCGFSSVSPGNCFFFDEGLAGVEPGSSWLFVFSSMGLLAGLLFAGYMLKIYIDFSQQNLPPNAELNLRMAILTLFCIHFCVEGYVVAAGSPLCVLFWIYLARCVDLLPNSQPEQLPKPNQEGFSC